MCIRDSLMVLRSLWRTGYVDVHHACMRVEEIKSPVELWFGIELTLSSFQLFMSQLSPTQPRSHGLSSPYPKGREGWKTLVQAAHVSWWQIYLHGRGLSLSKYCRRWCHIQNLLSGQSFDFAAKLYHIRLLYCLQHFKLVETERIRMPNYDVWFSSTRDV